MKYVRSAVHKLTDGSVSLSSMDLYYVRTLGSRSLTSCPLTNRLYLHCCSEKTELLLTEKGSCGCAAFWSQSRMAQ